VRTDHPMEFSDGYPVMEADSGIGVR
jgi:hypothetical protein